MSVSVESDLRNEGIDVADERSRSMIEVEKQREACHTFTRVVTGLRGPYGQPS